MAKFESLVIGSEAARGTSGAGERLVTDNEVTADTGDARDAVIH
jgi:hypothetical protein